MRNWIREVVLRGGPPAALVGAIVATTPLGMEKVPDSTAAEIHGGACNAAVKTYRCNALTCKFPEPPQSCICPAGQTIWATYTCTGYDNSGTEHCGSCGTGWATEPSKSCFDP